MTPHALVEARDVHAVEPRRVVDHARRPSTRTASLAVLGDTASPSATRAMPRRATAMASSAQFGARKECLALGSAARVVS